MSILNLRKNTKEAPKKVLAVSLEKKTEGASFSARGSASSLILRPRVTEKSHDLSEKNNVYVFEVAKHANKKQLAQAIGELYKVIPVKISVAAIRSKKIFSRGKWGVKKGGKKAYVYIKKGEKLEIF